MNIDTSSVKSKNKDFTGGTLVKQNGTVMIQVFHIKIILALCFLIRRDLDDT
jgi:hypothetical protein